IPTTVHEVVADEILYTAENNTTITAGKTAGWIIIPTEGYSSKTPLDLDGTKLSSSTSCLQVKADGGVFNNQKRVIHLLVTGITGVVASGNASDGRGFQIGATEYTAGMPEGTTMNVVAGNNSATNPVSCSGLDAKKTYIISVFAFNSDTYLYAIKLIAGATVTGLEAIAIEGELDNTDYSEGAEVDYSGLSVKGTFSNGSTATVERGILWSIVPELAVGTTDYTITATVGELTATKNVQLTITEVVLSSIAFKGSLNLASCYVGEPLDLAGLTVEAAYSNGTTEDVTAEASITTTEITKSDTVTITASYEGQIATQKAFIYVCKRPSTTGTVLLSYEHADTTPKGIELGSGLSIGSAKIHTNKDSANGIKLEKGYTSDGKYASANVVSLSVDGGFKPSDEIVVAAFFNNSSNTKQAQVNIFTLNADSTTNTLHTIGQAVNGRLVQNEPFEAVYTLTEAADTIRLGRLGDTATFIYTVKVLRPESGPSTAFEEAESEAKAVKVIRDG
ncbi:MAG: bacterial Ig-like domain-containing protein, partial [Paludibacteraceae bacterium]